LKVCLQSQTCNLNLFDLVQSQQLAMLRHSFLLVVFAGALACGALADDEGQTPPICDGKGQSTCNRKVEDDGSSSDGSAFIQSAVRVEIADSEEESAKSEEEAKTSQVHSDEASVKALMMNEFDRRDAAAAKVALAQNERMEKALRERDDQITHLQLNILELMKVLNPKFFDKLQDHGVNDLEEPMPSWEEVSELLLQRGGTTMVSSDEEKVRRVQASLKDLVLRSLVQLKSDGYKPWDRAVKEMQGTMKRFAKDAVNDMQTTVQRFATDAVNSAVNAIMIPLNKVIGNVKTVVTAVGKIPSDIHSAATTAIATAKTLATHAVCEGKPSQLDCDAAAAAIYTYLSGAKAQLCDETLSGTGGEGYRGCQSKTRSGKTCQSWESQHPWPHSNTASKHPGKGLGNHNYCRNPDGGSTSTIWCYTMDEDTRYEYCDPLPSDGQACITVGNRGVGDGHPCILPFVYNGISYATCTTTGASYKWCPTKVDSADKLIAQTSVDQGQWGECGSSCEAL